MNVSIYIFQLINLSVEIHADEKGGKEFDSVLHLAFFFFNWLYEHSGYGTSVSYA